MSGAHEQTGGRTSHGGHDMSAMLRANRRALIWTSWLTGVYFLIELIVGVWIGSIAVISDAFHTFSAVGGVLIALVAGKLAERPSDRYRTFGSYRAEIIGALINGLFLFAMAVVVIVMGAMRLRHPVELPPLPMVLTALGGLVTELISIRLLFASQRENLNMRGAFWHVIQTFVGSLIIIIAAAVIWLTGWTPIDPILGIGFGFVLFWASWTICRDALRILMETVPTGVDVVAVREALLSLDGVEDIHHVHAWALTSGRNLFSAHIRITENAEHEAVLGSAHDLLRLRYGFVFSTLQVERACRSDAAPELDFAS